MKLSTRCSLVLAVLLLPLASAFATTVTVTIGNNFYSPISVSLQTGDRVNFVWQAGVHPTTSESSQWSTFTLSASNASFLTQPFNTAGTFPYFCEAHGAPGLPLGQGMNGLITVTRTASASIDPNLAAATLNVYPNPSHGQVTVQVNQKAGAAYQLRLSNIIGQSIRTVALKPELTTAGLPLDLSDLPTGIYFYSLLVDGKAVATKRLVLQN